MLNDKTYYMRIEKNIFDSIFSYNTHKNKVKENILQ